MLPVASSSIALSDSDKEDADASSSESISLSEAFLANAAIDNALLITSDMRNSGTSGSIDRLRLERPMFKSNIACLAVFRYDRPGQPQMK
eukprot:521028-Ditylum_brightwellii.AAC.1